MTAVNGIFRYPVKSMQGEPCEKISISQRGITGDRAYALFDGEHVVSAKHWRKWANVLKCQAAIIDAGLQITLPNGQVVYEQDVSEVLSDFLGRSVELIEQAPRGATREADRAPVEQLYEENDIRQEPIALASEAGSFFDYAPVHVITTSTLQHLQALYPEGDFSVQRFRPNILIDTTVSEYDWLGRQITMGDVILSVIEPTPRCVITTLPQGNLPRDLGILQTILKDEKSSGVTGVSGTSFRTVVGVYAQVIQGGVVRVGTQVDVYRSL